MGEMEQRRDMLSVAVRVTAVLVAIFLAAFFVVTVNNMATISNQVQELKDGPFPTSVAAGHVETDIAQVETLAIHITHFRYLPERSNDLEEHFQDVDESMRAQLALIDPDALADPHEAYVLQADYDTLYVRLSNVMSLIQDEEATNEQIEAYVDESIMPLARSMRALANEILDETTDNIAATYTIVKNACTQTIIFACVLMVCVVAMLCLYMALLRRKNRQEEQLRTHLQDVLALAQSANEAKSDFFSNMSHDIRTPMNAIIGLTTIANDNIDDPLRVKQCLTRIMTSSKHLLSLINDVLDMNKIESGKATLSEERFFLPDLIEELIAIVQPQSLEKHLKTDIIINDIHHEELVGDTMRLRQIILNLVSNAIKYTNEGGEVRMIVTEDSSELEGVARLQFVVDDTGIGMEPSFLAHVFEPFEREHNDYTVFTEGTGLGMAITKNLVDLMGGRISVESEVGMGTKFTVCVPLRIAADMPKLDLTGFDGLHVLVVDDNYLVVQNAVHTLTDFGVRVKGTTSGADAAGLVTAAMDAGMPFDMVIVDLEMPNVDGSETVRRIREAAGTDAPMVVMASYGWDAEDSAARTEGAAALISKPLFRSRLYRTVKRLCIDGEPLAEAAAKARPAITGRVLLVDDNEINLEIGIELISKLGPEVEGVHGGLEAVAKVSDAPDGCYGLIFMDCKMPHMDGFEATKAIRKFTQERGRTHIPIVAMTANAFAEDREHALEVGMDGFMSKPIDMGELEETLRTYLSTEWERPTSI